MIVKISVSTILKDSTISITSIIPLISVLTIITILMREGGGCRAEGEENFISVKLTHNLSVSHGSHGGMGNEGRRRVST